MENDKLLNQMKNIKNNKDIEVLLNEDMKKHTSFKVGGKAEIFVKINTLEALKEILTICKNENAKTTIIGNGTNVIVKDEGISRSSNKIYK